jgi:hypothetical protein
MSDATSSARVQALAAATRPFDRALPGFAAAFEHARGHEAGSAGPGRPAIRP